MTTSEEAQIRSSSGAPVTSAPRIALLGWCDRFVEVKAGHPALWHINLLGLAPHRVSTFYPISLDGYHLVFGIYEPKAGETFVVEFLNPARNRSLELSVTITDVEATDPNTGNSTPVSDGFRIPGWALKPVTLDKTFMVLEPGKYEVYLRSEAGRQYLGSTNFLFAVTEFSSPEQLAALKSNPLSGKLVRIEFSCNQCWSRLRTYAGLERNPKLEQEGWIWNRSLADEFVCECNV